jgi:HK97 family phage prohead protease
VGKKYLNVPFILKQIGQEDGTFSGYGSTFGGEPDSYGDIIVKGAFKDSLAQGGYTGTGIKMLWSHKSDEPIGVWTSIYEDDKGLKVEGQLALGVQRADEVYKLMKLGAIDGMSIGYNIKSKEDVEYEKGIRFLKKINLWEVSPVVFPANISANITGVKSIESAESIRELELSLRELGMSKKESLAAIRKMKKLLRESEGIGAMEVMLKSIRDVRNSI